MLLRRLFAGAAAGAALLAGVGCSGGTAEGVAADLSKDNFAAELSDATTQQHSTHLEGEVSFQGQTMTMSGDLTIAQELADVEAQLEMQVPTQGVLEMRIVDSVFYMRGAGLSTESGKPWARIDMSDPTNPLAGFYSQLMSYTNPVDQTEMFRAVTDLENKGEESVDGVDTTHYEITVELRKALKETGLYEDLGAKAAGIASELPEDVTHDVWVATDTALIVRMSVDLAGASLDMHFSDWGEDVSVEAPPASQVSDLDF
ncbi:MAG: LppX_LprAFG lipoprotein [Nocardioidaceae bacterium]